MKKTIASLAIVVIVGVAMFSGCIETEPSTPTSTPSVKVTSSNNLTVTIGYIEKSSSHYYRIKGTIKNEGTATAESIKVTTRLYDKDGLLIGSSYTYTDISKLQPNEESTFSDLIETIADIRDRPCVVCELNATCRV